MKKVQQMLEALEKELRNEKQYSAADKLLPIIEEAGKDGWIPCSERPPETEGAHLITRETASGIKCVTMGALMTDGEFMGKTKVIAWRELPEPHKGE